MSNFLSDILFTLVIGLVLAPTVGAFLFDANANTTTDVSVRKKRSIIVGCAMFFAPTIVYLASYLFFTVLQG